jgi:RNA polymerase sigma factor (sigma-70 family)
VGNPGSSKEIKTGHYLIWKFRLSCIGLVSTARMKFLRSRKVFHEDDASVISAYRETSDSHYLGILFDRYSHLVFAVSMNYLKNEEDCKDAVIHIFERLSTDLKKYEIRNFTHWIHRVTRNYCLRQLSKKSFTVNIDDEINYFAAEEDEQETFTDQYLSYLEEGMKTLNEEQGTCIRLFYLEEKSYREIETITGFNYEKVKSYIQNGKRNLKIFLLKKK